MHGKDKKVDRRASRTHRSLRGALIELILEKRYDAITVQNIIDRADVGRSTFYAHYRDKDDLFLRDIEDFLSMFVAHIEWGNIRAGRCIPIRELFQHVQDFQHFPQALAKSRKIDWFYRNGLRYLTCGIESALNSMLMGKSQTSIPLNVLSSYLASGVLNMLRWWIEHGMPYPPERMDEIFHELVMPGFRSALGKV